MNAAVETVTLAAGTNSLTTAAANQTINANATTDGQTLTLAGTHNATVNLILGDLTSTSSGDITVIATTGTNVITTAGGADTITGGAGVDTITGGLGADTFVFATGDTGITEATADTIADFVSTADCIDFSGGAGTNANFDNATGGDVGNFAGALAAVNGGILDGTVIYAFQTTGADGFLFYDFDADGAADEVILLTGIDETEIAFGDIIA